MLRRQAPNGAVPVLRDSSHPQLEQRLAHLAQQENTAQIGQVQVAHHVLREVIPLMELQDAPPVQQVPMRVLLEPPVARHALLVRIP
jgi:hypothetical protein